MAAWQNETEQVIVSVIYVNRPKVENLSKCVIPIASRMAGLQCHAIKNKNHNHSIN